MNPYEILGIKKDATDKVVKKAYRDLSKVKHPDVGGDKEEFHALHMAYQTLIDEERRKLYDEFGVILDKSFESSQQEVNKRLSQLFDSWVNQLVKTGQEASLRDFLLKGVTNAEANLNKSRQDLKWYAEILRKRKRNTTCEEGKPNLIHSFIERHLNTIVSETQKNTNERYLVRCLKENIKTYDFEEEAVPAGLMYNTNMNASTTYTF